MIEFLYRTAALLLKRKCDLLNAETEQKACLYKKRKIEQRHQTYVITSTKCIPCSEDHKLFRCAQFMKLAVNEQFKLVKEASLYTNCLRKNITKNTVSAIIHYYTSEIKRKKLLEERRKVSKMNQSD